MFAFLNEESRVFLVFLGIQKYKCQTLQQYLALRTAHCMTSPGPKGCRNQVLPRPDWLLEGWVGFTARLVFTSPFLSSMVGITTTGMRVHCSSVPSEDITSVYPSSQVHALVCREQAFYNVQQKNKVFWEL